MLCSGSRSTTITTMHVDVNNEVLSTLPDGDIPEELWNSVELAENIGDFRDTASTGHDPGDVEAGQDLLTRLEKNLLNTKQRRCWKLQ